MLMYNTLSDQNQGHEAFSNEKITIIITSAIS